MQWMKLPSKTYFERDSIQYLQKCRDVERVMIVTDHAMVELGFLDRIIEQLAQPDTVEEFDWDFLDKTHLNSSPF